MKTQGMAVGICLEQPALFEMVEKLVKISSFAATKNHSHIINDVPDSLAIKADPVVLASIIGNLLNTVVSHAKDSCIRISAKIYHDIILIHIKDSNSFNSYAVNAGLQMVQPMAEKIGGFLEITSQRHKETTIAFSFLNLREAA